MNTLDKALTAPRFIIYTVVGFVAVVLIWSYFATVDQVVIGEGKVKPKLDIQEIQSLEGGIVRQIMVSSGDTVVKGQPLLRLDDIAFKAALNEQLQELDRLTAHVAQLRAQIDASEHIKDEAYKDKVDIADYFSGQSSAAARNAAKSAYLASMNSLILEGKTINQKLQQTQNSLNEAVSRKGLLQDNLEIARKELSLNEPAFKKGAISGVEMLKLRRAVNDTKSELDATTFEISRKQEELKQYNLEQSSLVAKFKSETVEKLNEKDNELSQLTANNTAITDKVERTVIDSPVAGIVKSILIATAGGVIQPGETIIEIVPFDKDLVVEVKLLPQDVGFLTPGLDALVKLTAYDFIVYGGLSGKLVYISADTVQDDEGNSHYIGHVILEGELTNSGKLLELIPGMQASVDIVAGKKTVLQYWLKPILRAKANSMREM